jgi:hypothetical protein
LTPFGFLAFPRSLDFFAEVFIQDVSVLHYKSRN